MESAEFSAFAQVFGTQLLTRRVEDASGHVLFEKLAAWGKGGEAARRRLRQHFLICTGLKLRGVASPLALTAQPHGLVLNVPWLPGQDLAAYVDAHAPAQAFGPAAALPLEEILRLAEALAQILAGLAERGVVHGALQASHVLVQEGGAELALISFGRARFARAAPAVAGAAVLTHAHDLRALGRLLLRMFSGARLSGSAELSDATLEALFAAELQPLALPAAPAAHDHETGPPPDVYAERLATLPPPLRLLLNRLLQAGTAQGYKHAGPVLMDLARCRAQLQNVDGADAAATLGLDLGQPPELDLPQARLGREAELAVLMAAYAEVAGVPQELGAELTAEGAKSAAAKLPSAVPGKRPGSLLLVLDGQAGIGKTAVIADACRVMAEHGARIGMGKFNQFGDSRPLWALSQALDAVVEGLLAETEHRQQALRQRVLAALQGLGQVLIDAVPQLSRWLGPQSPPPSLSGEASRMRLELLMRRFVAALATREQPLVLVLDDVHWADPVSLKLLRGLLRDADIRHLLLLAAYRPEAVGEGHALPLALAELQADGAELRRVSVRAWTHEDLLRLLAAAKLVAAQGEGEREDELADLVYRSTAGNPLGSLLALRELHRKACLGFDARSQCWLIDQTQAAQLLKGSHSAELAARQLAQLPAPTRQTLSTAAFLGAAFSVDTLAAALGRGRSQVLAQLWPALASGLLLEDLDLGSPVELPRLKLAHDIVQFAAHALVGQQRDAIRHAEIGRALLAAYDTDLLLQEHLFEVVLHFNQAGPAAVGASERERVMGLNVAAGRKARRGGAAAAALAHFNHALALLEEQDKARDALGYFEICWEAAEAAYLAADFGRLDALCAGLDRWVADAALGAVPSARVFELRIQGLVARNQMVEALALGQQALALLGVELAALIPPAQWPQVPTLESLALGEPSNPRVDTALRLLVWLTPCAYITSFEMYARVILTMVGLADAHPSSPLTAITFTNYGLTLCGIGRNPEGFAASELALVLSERLGDEGLHCKVSALGYGFLRHWQLPAEASLRPLLDTLEACLLCGDQEYMGYASFLYCDKAWGLQPLGELLQLHEPHTKLVRQFGHDFSWRHCQVWLQFLLALQSDTQPRLSLQGRVFDERVDIAELMAANNHFSLFTAHVLRAWLAWHRHDWEQAFQACRVAQDYAMTAVATLLSVEHVLLSLLCELRVTSDEQSAARIQALLERLQVWAQMAPANFAHKLALAQAMCLSAQGEVVQAWEAFERAQRLVQASAFLHDRALIAELSAEFYLAQGHRRLALELLQRAYQDYLSWGATAISDRLLRQHAALLVDLDERVQIPPRPVGMSLREKFAALLQEFAVDRVVVLVEGLSTALVSERQPEQTVSLVRMPLGADSEAVLPLALLHEVWSGGRFVCLNEPHRQLAWGSDAYFASRRPASVAAFGVQRGAGMMGGVYLESRGLRLLSAAYLGARLAWHVQAIVDEMRAEFLAEQLQESALLDPLTHLPNRSAFIRMLDLTLARMRNVGERGTALALVQVRDFDERVIYQGQDLGDALLLALSQRLNATAKAAGNVALLNRHCFGLLYWGLSVEAVLQDCRRLQELLQGSYLQGKDIPVEIDIAVRIDDGQGHGASFLRDAKLALDAAARAGGGAVLLFDPLRHREGQDSALQNEAALRRELRLRSLAEKRDREKSKFIASAVHDLRQPLQAIGTALEPAYLAAKAGDMRRTEQLIEIARRSSRLMREQLNAILDISRLESGLTQPSYAVFELKLLLQSVLAQLAPQAEDLGVRVLLDLEPPHLLFVRSDRQLLQRLLLNLVQNGIKYRSAQPAGGAFVCLRARQLEQQVQLAVEDNGIGIASEMIESGAIFQPFFQAQSRPPEGDRGVGLGLSIVKAILSLLPDHHLSLRSTLGQGSCFTLSLPSSGLGEINLDGEPTGGDFDLRGLDLSHLFVLLVEDDELVMQSTEALLDAFGALHERALSLDDLRKLLPELEREPDVVLSDYRLPQDCTALDVQALVRELLGTIPLVVLTGELLSEQALAQLGQVPLLHKPIEPVELLRCISQVTASRLKLSEG
ncbi:AAA family ATPase [Paucibacter sp. KBW04]|uniref:AAA family ATPase n=1 Tax=Paucibacter sp. KBW04 TaxID=2153361 RepID=UPI000F55E652|nr:AAA family ATPase [Paucibacter sp. KBW04]